MLLRPKGMGAVAAIVHIEIDGSKPLTDVELLSLEIELVLKYRVSKEFQLFLVLLYHYQQKLRINCLIPSSRR